MTSDARIPVFQPHLWGREEMYVRQALTQTWLSGQSPEVARFEAAFADRLGTRHALAVSSGTAAVHLALRAIEIGPGDEVIVPDFSMIAPVFAVLYTGATPVPVGPDSTWNLSPEAVEAAITPRTRAILVVHTYGHPAQMNPILAMADARGLPVIEDAAEALGATYRGRKTGTMGIIGCFSFYANKAITTGNDLESRFLHTDLAYNYRMGGLQAALGLAQLEFLEESVRARERVADRYRGLLAGLEELEMPPHADDVRHSYWVFGVLVRPGAAVRRRELQEALGGRGIETRRVFSPVRDQPVLERMGVRGESPSPSRCDARTLSENGFYLPSYPGITDDDLQTVARAIRELVR
jgi:perosamine synthetase